MSTHRITLLSSSPEPELPITLDMAKAHLRITDDDEDDLINAYIDACVGWAEHESHRAIARRQYLVVRDQFPVGGWMLPLGKVQSIESVEYIDADGDVQTWASSEYELDNASDFQSRLRPASGTSWPTVGDYWAAARVSLTAGWDGSAVPYAIKQALLLKLASLYDVRAPGDADSNAIERAAMALLASWTLPVFSA